MHSILGILVGEIGIKNYYPSELDGHFSNHLWSEDRRLACVRIWQSSVLPLQRLLQVLNLLQTLLALGVLCPLDQAGLACAVDGGGGKRLSWLVAGLARVDALVSLVYFCQVQRHKPKVTCHFESGTWNENTTDKILYKKFSKCKMIIWTILII